MINIFKELNQRPFLLFKKLKFCFEIQYLLERLAAQKLEPKDLRTFLRLSDPLACLNDEEMGQKRDESLQQPTSSTTPGKF